MNFKIPIRTRYSETGQDGIIHHSSYVIYFEVARIEFLKTLGCDINEFEKRKILCPVIDLSIKYLSPLRSIEDIFVHVSVESHTKVRFCLSYQIFRGDTLIATANISNCFLNDSFKPIPIPKEVLEHLMNK